MASPYETNSDSADDPSMAGNNALYPGEEPRRESRFGFDWRSQLPLLITGGVSAVMATLFGAMIGSSLSAGSIADLRKENQGLRQEIASTQEYLKKNITSVQSLEGAVQQLQQAAQQAPAANLQRQVQSLQNQVQSLSGLSQSVQDLGRQVQQLQKSAAASPAPAATQSQPAKPASAPKPRTNR